MRTRFVLTTIALVVAAGVAIPDARAATCDTSWLLAVDGSWTDAARWTNGVPNAADPARDFACVTLAGTYTVTLQTNGSAAGLTLGGATGTQTLRIVAGGAQDAVLVLNQAAGADGVLANGVLALESPSTGSARLTSTVNPVVNRGTLRTAGLAGAGSSILGRFDNQGTMSVNDQTRASGTTTDWTTSGQLTIAASAALDHAGSFSQTAGQISNGGSFRKAGGLFSQSGGSATGATIELSGVELRLPGGSGSFRLLGAANVLGADVGAGHTISVVGTAAAGAAALRVQASRSSAGTISLESADGASGSRLEVAAGAVLTNAFDGEILSKSGGGERAIRGDIIDVGHVSIEADTQTDAGSDWTVTGGLSVAAGAQFSHGPGASMTVNGFGVIAGEGTYRQQGGLFAQTGGYTGYGYQPPLQLADVDLRPSGGAGDFVLFGLGNVLGSNIGADQQILVSGAEGNATLTTTTARTNNGKIRLHSPDSAWARLSATTSATFTNNGAILPEYGGTNLRYIDGDILNRGELWTPGYAGVFAPAPGSDWTNEGDGYLVVSPGTTLDLTQGSFTNQQGTTLVGGHLLLDGILRYRGADVRTNAGWLTLFEFGGIEDEHGNDALARLSANAASGRLECHSGCDFVTSVPFTNEGVVSISSVSGSTFTSTGDYTQAEGLTTVYGDLIAAGGSVVVNGGVLEGDGFVRPRLVNNAEVRPGIGTDPGVWGSTGALFVVGSYVQTSAGRLSIQIGGSGSGPDQIHVFGSAALAGAIAVSTAFYNPAPGEEFIVVTTSTGRTGAFSSASFTGGTTYGLKYEAKEAILVAGASPTVSLSPTSLAFGNVPVNSTSAGKQITVKNAGSAALTISGFNRSGANQL
ncbi:MAG: hypothetical protein ABR521_08605, partial [Gaiellaceae bacterium]